MPPRTHVRIAFLIWSLTYVLACGGSDELGSLPLPDAAADGSAAVSDTVAPDTTPDIIEDTATDVAADVPDDTTPDTFNDDVPSDASPDTLDDASPDTLDDAGTDVLDDASPDTLDDAGTDVLDDAGTDVLDDAGSDVLDDAGTDATPDTLDDAGNDATTDATTDVIADTTPDAADAAVRATLAAAPLVNGGAAPAAATQRLYVRSRRELTITNSGTTALSVTVTTIPVDDGRPEEWLISRSPVDPAPLTEPLPLGPGASSTVMLDWFPVQSGPRSARLRVAWTGSAGDGLLESTLTGTGADALLFAPLADPQASTAWSWGLASSGSTLRAGSMAVDEGGHQYVTGTARRWTDAAAPNVVVGRIGPDGEAHWLREWHASFVQESPDPSQNGESGGAAGCIDVDDRWVWIAARAATDAIDTAYTPVVVQIDRETGDLQRTISLHPTGTRPTTFGTGAQAYALDASHPERLFVVGTTDGQLKVLVWAIDKATGALDWAYALDPAPGSTDRGYSVAWDGAGALYVGGVSGSRALLARIVGIDGDSPVPGWVKSIFLGVGTNLPSLDTDDDGDVYAAVDVRGLATQLRAMRVGADGSHGWSRAFDVVSRTERHNSHGITVDGDDVWLAGRIGLSGYDTTLGDGAIVHAATDGSYRAAMMYYGGTTSATGAGHRIKHVVVQGGQLHALAEIGAAATNTSALGGYWYTVPDVISGLPAGDGASRWQEVPVAFDAFLDVSATATWTRLTDAVHSTATVLSWLPPSPAAPVQLLENTTMPAGHTLIGGFVLRPPEP